MAFSLLPTPLRRNVRRLLEVFLDQRPASRLIRHTARQQWKLIAVNMTSSIGQALTEGATLGVIFMAVEWISENSKSAGGMVSKTSPLLNAIPGLEGLLHTLPSAATFIALMVLALALQIGQSLTLYLNSVSLEYFMARCRAVVTGRIHTQILSFSFPCASSYRIGNLSEFVSKGPEAVATQINIINQLLVGLLMIAMYLAILLKLSPWLMLAALGLSAVIGLVQKQLLPRIRLAANRVVDIEVSVNSRVIEDIQALRLLHSSGQLQMAINRLKGSLRDLELSLRRRGKLVQIIDPVSRVLPVAAFALIATLSLVVFDNRSAGVLPNLVTFMLALQRLNSRLSGISSCFNGLSANSGNINFLNKILEPRDKQFRRIGGTSFAGIKRNISFENVELRYTDNLAPALSRLNFSLPKGHTVALVGGSGAGKSSIADLLVGLYSPSEGRILIDGIDLETIDLSSWQQRLGVVSQDTFLLNASLAENIAVGCPWATRANIEAAAESAQAAGFIADMPEGYETTVGERGYRLSGGQRQRISLARAILRQPDLLILDEATSALDSESERLVQDAIKRFEGKYTVLVIAHRLSTIVHADEIIVIEKGRIIERGNHSQLVALAGKYNKLWEAQSRNTTPLTPQPV